jgi:putative membrane protein
VVVNITLGLAAQIVFTVLGMATLAWTTGAGLDALTSSQAIVYSLVAAGAFYALQRHGLFRLLRRITMPVGGAAWLSDLLAKGERLDVAIHRIYADRTAIRRCFAVSVGYWISGTVEIWLAMSAFGFSSWPKALILEAAVQGVRSAAFFLPGALGAQEGGYILAGGFLGIPAEFALALSLIRRFREVVWGVPGLLVWQVMECRRKGARRAVESDAAQPANMPAPLEEVSLVR